MGSSIDINGPISGGAFLAGDTIMLGSSVAGDVELSGNNISFGPNATVSGVLTINHKDPESIEVPASVAQEASIKRNVIEEDETWAETGTEALRPTFFAKLKGIIGTAIAIAVVAVIMAAIMPNVLYGARSAALERPIRTIWIGFLTLSALVGSMIMFALTGIGILLAPISLIALLVLWFLGYVVGTYSLGVSLLRFAGRGDPSELGDKAIAAGIGALIAGVLALLPIIGWWLMLLLAWIGAGALIARLFDPILLNRANP